MDQIRRCGGLAAMADSPPVPEKLAGRGRSAHDGPGGGIDSRRVRHSARGRRSNSRSRGRRSPILCLRWGQATRPESVKRAFRFEAWGGDLIVQRELEKEADLAVVQEIGPGPGRAHFQVYLDQEENKITIFSQLGKQLASLKVGSSKSPAYPGVDLTNLRGDLRLEWLRIVRWSGEPPREVQADQARIHRADGSIVYGQVTRFDAGSREFVVKSGAGETRIAPEKISSVFLSRPGRGEAQRAACGLSGWLALQRRAAKG